MKWGGWEGRKKGKKVQQRIEEMGDKNRGEAGSEDWREMRKGEGKLGKERKEGIGER